MFRETLRISILTEAVVEEAEKAKEKEAVIEEELPIVVTEETKTADDKDKAEKVDEEEYIFQRRGFLLPGRFISKAPKRILLFL